jgi:hypothetical protein
MTLFQFLATGAGYEPVLGPGSSCLDEKCVGQKRHALGDWD